MKFHPHHTHGRHTHLCQECGREFYLCSERDCDLAPAVCRGCEMDRQDAYVTSLEPTQPKGHDHAQLPKFLSE